MKICIIGAGVVGSYLAKKLSQEGYDVAIIDKDRKKIEEIQTHIDVAAFNCDAFDEECIGQLSEYDLFIVATNKDEINLSVALMLKAIYGKDKVIVRVDKDILSKKEIEKFLAVEIVNTFNEIFRNIQAFIRYPFISSINELEAGKFVIFSYTVKRPDLLSNTKISDLKEIRDRVPFTVVLIERNGKPYIPSGNKVILEGDTVYILAEKDRLEKLIKALNIQIKPVKSVTFLGMSKVGMSILKKIYGSGLNIKVIEEDIQLCESIATQFPEVMVLNGKITDKHLLESEQVGGSDIIISSSYREDNILSCILVKKLGAKKVIAIIENPEYEEIAQSLGIDIPIVSRKMIARKVYKRIKHRGFIDIFELKENIKIYELHVGNEMEGKKVSEISTGRFVILGVVREDKMKMVSGEFLLKGGDKLIILEIEEAEE
ncbi:MAG: NAD-binding protein [Persephonella sp.]|nr:NAD-binding protein [Persephonella sp.]